MRKHHGSLQVSPRGSRRQDELGQGEEGFLRAVLLEDLLPLQLTVHWIISQYKKSGWRWKYPYLFVLEEKALEELTG